MLAMLLLVTAGCMQAANPDTIAPQAITAGKVAGGAASGAAGEDRLSAATNRIYWMPAFSLVAGFEMRNLAARFKPGHDDGTGRHLWSLPVNTARPYSMPIFPESGASYHILVFDAQPQAQPGSGPDASTQGSDIEIHLQGQFDQARYASFHVYDPNTGKVLGSANDMELAGADGTYDLIIRQSATGERIFRENRKTVLEVPLSPSGRLAIVYRIYLPLTRDYTLPAIAFFDRETGERLDPGRNRLTLPEFVSTGAGAGQMRVTLDQMLALQVERERAGHEWPIRFHVQHPETSAFLASRDIIYAFALIERRPGWAYVRLRPPPGTQPGMQNGPVRYWSACLSGIRETSTAGCLPGDEAVTGPDGRVHLLIGRKPPTVGQAGGPPAELPDWIHRLDWGVFSGPQVLIIRQLMAPGGRGAPGTYSRVPDIGANREGDISAILADRHIGDHAPIGRYCSREQMIRPGACLPAIAREAARRAAP